MDANQWKALKAASLAAFLEAAKAVPGVGQVLAPLHTALQTYRETLAGLDDLPTHTRRALQAMIDDYRRLLKREAADPNLLARSLPAALDIVRQHGPDAHALAAEAHLDPERAAALALRRGQAALEALRDPAAQNLAERLVHDYYRILFEHRDALAHLGVPALQVLLERTAELLKRQEQGPRQAARPQPPVNLPAAQPIFVGREKEMDLLLETLDPATSVTLLRELGVQADDPTLAQLARACGHLPLALWMAAAFLRNHPDWSVAEYLERLEAGNVAAVQGLSLERLAAVLGLSLERLAAEQPDLAARWHALGVMPAPFDRDLAAGVWGVLVEQDESPLSETRDWEDDIAALLRALQARLSDQQPTVQPLDAETTRNALSELRAWSLVKYDEASGLYHLHDLLRGLARPDDAARARHAHTALALAREAEQVFLRGNLEALARFDVLWPHLQAAWAWMRTRDDPAARRWLRDFGGVFPYLLDLRIPPAERIPYLQAAVQAARALGDKRAEGALLGNLGNAYRDLGRVEEAIEHYQQALAIAREIGDRRMEGNSLGNLGLAYADLGRVEEAITLYRQALVIAREIGDRRGEGNHLGALGNAYYSLGRVVEAIEHYEQALAIVREIGDKRNEGAWLGALGNACYSLGRVAEAIERYEQALAIAREIGDKRNEGIHAWNLGLAYEKLGDCARAAEWMQIRVDYERAIGHPAAEKHAQYLAQVRARAE